MYHTFTRFFIALLLIAGAFQSGKSLPTDCPLPPPDNVWVTGSTPTSISLAWTPVLPPSYYVNYRVRFYDLTTSTQLSDEFTVLTYHTRTGLIPGHEYRITVSASTCNNGPFGDESIPVDYFTNPIIIVDDIAQNSCNPGIGTAKSIGTYDVANLIAATPEQTDYDQVWHLRVDRTYQQVTYRAEFNLWSDCDGIPQFDKITETNVARTPSNDGETNLVDFDYVYGGVSLYDFIRIIPGNAGQSGGQLVTPVRIYYQADYITAAICSDNTGRNECGQEERQSHKIPTGIQQIEASLSLTAMPNPSSGTFMLAYTLPTESAAEFTLFDGTGKIVRALGNTGVLDAGTHTATLQVEDIPPGLYFLALQTNTERRVITLIKQ